MAITTQGARCWFGPSAPMCAASPSRFNQSLEEQHSRSRRAREHPAVTGDAR